MSEYMQNNVKSTAVIRTSDRIQFKQCRRKWDYSSHLRQNLEPKVKANPLWLGPGVHYALEDYHGYNVYKHPKNAFIAYAYATSKYDREALPSDFNELLALGMSMMEYYPTWLEGRDPLKTYVFNGIPQIEVPVKIDIPLDKIYDPLGKIKHLYDAAEYSLTFDRVIIDEHDRLWIVEYKTAKNIQTHHLANDPQVTTYYWAASHLYPLPIAGVIHYQFRKDAPKMPKLLKSGKFSTAANQITSHRLYRRALIDHYGSVNKAPEDNVKFLDTLAMGETEDMDKYIFRTKIYRSDYTSYAVASQILQEVSDMLNPELFIYPAPCRDCAYICSLASVCNQQDDGGDYEDDLKLNFKTRDPSYDEWRKCLPDPSIKFHPDLITN